eukprot:6878895-Prymnesium_polylepis.1
MPRLLRALRLMRLVAQLPFQGELLSFLGIAKQVAAVLMLGHWIGCLWWLLQDSQDKVAAAHQFEGGSWLIINGYVLPDGTLQIDFPETYLLSFSAALYMLVGNTDGAVTTAEKVYAATMMIVDQRYTPSTARALKEETLLCVKSLRVSAATLLGTRSFPNAPIVRATSLAPRAGAERYYRARIDQIQLTMRKLHLPPALCARIDQYYAYLWHAKGTFDLKSTHSLTELSMPLEAEVLIYMHRETVSQVPFFASVKSVVISKVVFCLKPE